MPISVKVEGTPTSNTHILLCDLFLFKRVGDSLIEIGKLGPLCVKEDKVVAFEGVTDSSHNEEDFKESTAVDEKLWRRDMQTKLHRLDSGPKDQERAMEQAPPKHEKKGVHHHEKLHHGQNQDGKKNEMFKVKRTAGKSW